MRGQGYKGFTVIQEAHGPALPSGGGNDDSDFRELHTAREFSEDDEETTSQGWGTPRELTFSYIAFDGVVGSGARRDSVARRPRPQGRSVSEPRDQPPQPDLGDSLESIPSLSQSSEPGRHGNPDTVPPAERPLDDLRLQLDQLGWAARGAGSGEDSATSSSTPLEDEAPDGLEAGETGKGEVSKLLGPKPQGWVVPPPGTSKEKAHGLCSLPLTELDVQPQLALSSPPEVVTPHPIPISSSGTPQAWIPSLPRSQDLNSGPEDPTLEEEQESGGPQEREPNTLQCLNSTDQSEFSLGPHPLGKQQVLGVSIVLGREGRGLGFKGTEEGGGEGRGHSKFCPLKVSPLSEITTGFLNSAWSH